MRTTGNLGALVNKVLFWSHKYVPFVKIPQATHVICALFCVCITLQYEAYLKTSDIQDHWMNFHAPLLQNKPL